jgi:hypothetical protein
VTHLGHAEQHAIAVPAFLSLQRLFHPAACTAFVHGRFIAVQTNMAPQGAMQLEIKKAQAAFSTWPWRV